MKNLQGTGLKHNPCQGCKAYYTRYGLFGQCIMELDNACPWIHVYDNAPNQAPDADAKSSGGCGKYRNMLEDVVNELDLSNTAIEKYGPLGTPPAELVKLVLDEKDRIIALLKSGRRILNDRWNIISRQT